MVDLSVNDADWVSRYRIEYFVNGLWVQYKEELDGNKRPEDINVEVLNPPIWADKVRLIPTVWHRHVSMRAGLIGCGPSDPSFPHPKGPPADPELQKLQSLDQSLDAATAPYQQTQSLAISNSGARKNEKHALEDLENELENLKRQSEASSFSLLSKGRPNSMDEVKKMEDEIEDQLKANPDVPADVANAGTVTANLKNDLKGDVATAGASQLMNEEQAKADNVPSKFSPVQTGTSEAKTSPGLERADLMVEKSDELVDAASKTMMAQPVQDEYAKVACGGNNAPPCPAPASGPAGPTISTNPQMVSTDSDMISAR
jgi:hypothetical protein